MGENPPTLTVHATLNYCVVLRVDTAQLTLSLETQSPRMRQKFQNIQLKKMDIIHLLNKPYVNVVTLRDRNYLKSSVSLMSQKYF